MKYDVNVYQVVVDLENRNPEKERMFTKCMFGKTPTKEEFKNLYEKVLSFSIDSDLNSIFEVCELCFAELNHEDIYNNPEKYNLKVFTTFRSLSVGDFLEIDNKLYLVKMQGFSKYLDKTICENY